MLPRIAATCSAVLKVPKPLIVALTILIGGLEPNDLDKIFVIIARSTTARTGHPAINPVPSGSGCKNTRPAT